MELNQRTSNSNLLSQDIMDLHTLHVQNQAMEQNLKELLLDSEKQRQQVEEECNELRGKLDKAQKRLSGLDNKIGILKGLPPAENTALVKLFPFDRFSNDVLRVLFEHCAQPKRDAELTLKTVAYISRVCKNWHFVALNTPTLWTDIYVSMEEGRRESRQSFLKLVRDRARSRDKDRVISITIDDLQTFYEYPTPRGPTITTLKAFIKSLQLDQFGAIDTLDLCLTKSTDITALKSSTLDLSRMSIKQVIITTFDKTPLESYWDCSWLPKQSGSLTVLQLDNIGRVNLEGDDSFPNIQELYLEGIHIPSIAVELRRFPNLKQLFIQGEEFNMDPLLLRVELPELWELKVLDVKQFPWAMITAGKLRKLSTNYRTQDALDFMRLHRSIAHFIAEATLNEKQFNDLAKNLSNVEILDADGEIGGLWEPVGPANTLLPFPKLRHLIIKLWDATGNRTEDDIEVGIEVSEEMVENWLRARHFRAGLKEDGLDVQVIDTWEIDGSYDALDQASWRESLLLENCTQSLTALEPFRDEMKTWVLTLQWSN